MEQPPKYIETLEQAPRAQRIEIPVSRRLERMRSLSRLLDTAFTLPGGFRIGIDPIIGLIPAIGDFIASSLSIWFLYDAARLGIPKRVLTLMVLNVMLEAAVGTIPVLGNVADAIWKANARNMALVRIRAVAAHAANGDVDHIDIGEHVARHVSNLPGFQIGIDVKCQAEVRLRETSK